MRAFTVLLASLVVILAGCGGEPGEEQMTDESARDKLVVMTDNYPLAYFAERIGNDLVEVHFPAPSGEDPAFWKPDADTIAAYQQSDLILLNGAGYAKWTELAALPSSRVVDTSAGIGNRLLPVEGTVTHSHGPEGEHEHLGYASTTWLDPALAVQQARAIATVIASKRPEHEASIEQRLASLIRDLEGLDNRLAAAAEAIGDTPLLFSHPVYQYLIGRYGLNGVEVHWEPDQAPDGHGWEHLETLLRTHPAKWMVWEAEPLPEIVTELEARGISSVVFHPCGNRPSEADYLSVMEENAATMARIAG